MSDLYSSMQQMARELLAPTIQNGLGQGEIKLTRVTPGTPGPNPWEAVEPTTQTETLKGAVRGVSQRLVGTEVGGTVILASDRQAICTVPAMQYQAGDVLNVDGVPVHILSFEHIPAAGIASAVKFILRG